LTREHDPHNETTAQPPVRDSGPVEGVRGNREVPPTGHGQSELAALSLLAERFAEVERERDQHLDDLRRLAAEFDNYRKRVARDQEGLVARANERLVKELLPVLDDLERALEAAEEHEEAKLEEGVRLVHRNLAGLLEREGLAEIETNGRFDPHVHEALLAQPSDQEEGAVIDVVQKGYTLGDRVIRPARVVVSGGDGG
jgi:molecular chaperone GrpE